MEKSKHSISIQRTATVSLYGNTADAEYVWIVTHGYGMLAEFFIDKFEGLINDKHLVICPEALSRFYLEGMTGRVGATWMTSHHRDDEIKDYIQYLEHVYAHYVPATAKKVVLLGFSQGLSTISRWYMHTSQRADMLVGWGAAFPDDVLKNKKFGTIPTKVYIGLQDEFIPENMRNAYIEKVKNSNLPIELNYYEGKHTLEPLPLQALIDFVEHYL